MMTQCESLSFFNESSLDIDHDLFDLKGTTALIIGGCLLGGTGKLTPPGRLHSFSATPNSDVTQWMLPKCVLGLQLVVCTKMCVGPVISK